MDEIKIKIIKEGGKELIGSSVEQIVNGKFSVFTAKGVIIDYFKVKGKGGGANVITGGKYLIDFGNNKKYWRRRCEFKIIQPQK